MMPISLPQISANMMSNLGVSLESAVILANVAVSLLFWAWEPRIGAAYLLLTHAVIYLVFDALGLSTTISIIMVLISIVLMMFLILSRGGVTT